MAIVIMTIVIMKYVEDANMYTKLKYNIFLCIEYYICAIKPTK